MTYKTINMTFFTDRYALNLFFSGESVCFFYMEYIFDSNSL